jgi:hypothetical protein
VQLVVLVWAALNYRAETTGQEGLDANLAGARLPNTPRESSTVYDGVDNINSLGGYDYTKQGLSIHSHFVTFL